MDAVKMFFISLSAGAIAVALEIYLLVTKKVVPKYENQEKKALDRGCVAKGTELYSDIVVSHGIWGYGRYSVHDDHGERTPVKRVTYEYFVNGVKYKAKFIYSEHSDTPKTIDIYYDAKNPKKYVIKKNGFAITFLTFLPFIAFFGTALFLIKVFGLTTVLLD